MTSQEQKEAGYITLKEASERFGYAPDYIGQLIRKGKIEGKQVYANVAWMTTPEAIQEYLAKEKRPGRIEREKKSISVDTIVQMLLGRDVNKILSSMLYATLALLVVLLLVVFYFLSIAVNNQMNERAKERLRERAPAISVMVERDHLILRRLPEHISSLATMRI